MCNAAPGNAPNSSFHLAQASSPLFEEVDADSPFPGDWFAKCRDVLVYIAPTANYYQRHLSHPPTR